MYILAENFENKFGFISGEAIGVIKRITLDGPFPSEMMYISGEVVFYPMSEPVVNSITTHIQRERTAVEKYKETRMQEDNPEYMNIDFSYEPIDRIFVSMKTSDNNSISMLEMYNVACEQLKEMKPSSNFTTVNNTLLSIEK